MLRLQAPTLQVTAKQFCAAHKVQSYTLPCLSHDVLFVWFWFSSLTAVVKILLWVLGLLRLYTGCICLLSFTSRAVQKQTGCRRLECSSVFLKKNPFDILTAVSGCSYGIEMRLFGTSVLTECIFTQAPVRCSRFSAHFVAYLLSSFQVLCHTECACQQLSLEPAARLLHMRRCILAS